MGEKMETGGTLVLRCAGSLRDLAGEVFNANDRAFVEAAGNQLAVFAGLNLEINLATFHMIDAREARDLRA
jgi:hypothetical protein